MTASLGGQWLQYNELMYPQIVMDLDPIGTRSRGTVYAFTRDQNSPSAFFQIDIASLRRTTPITVRPRPFDAGLCRELSLRDVAQYFPDANFPEVAELKFEKISRDELKASFETDRGGTGEVILERASIPSRSLLDEEANVFSWETFKEEIETLEFERYAFRGQYVGYPLQTSFHRTKRKDLHRYLNEDLQTLHRRLTGYTNHVFNLDIPQELGAFLNLAQHHGFPTPLLDWTYSPFIAAWFAFFEVLSKKSRLTRASDGKVRIFCLDKSELTRLRQFNHVTLAVPHTSILEALPIENARAVPQQGLLMLTNLQNIEQHLFRLGESNGIQYLRAYDIPHQDALRAIEDLGKMGITQSTMMPGVESVCRDLRSRRF